MQSNYASDLRNILRNVFELNRSPDDDDNDDDDIVVEEAIEAKESIQFTDINNEVTDLYDTSDDMNAFMSRSNTFTNEDSLVTGISGDYSPTAESLESDETQTGNVRFGTQTLLLPPIWVPDELVSMCTLCFCQFTIIRRRHHCRNCGQIYCNNCSNNFMPLVQYGYVKPVRVCSPCHRQLNDQSSDQINDIEQQS